MLQIFCFQIKLTKKEREIEIRMIDENRNNFVDSRISYLKFGIVQAVSRNYKTRSVAEPLLRLRL